MNRIRLTTFEALLRNLRKEMPEITYFEMSRWVVSNMTEKFRKEDYGKTSVKLKPGRTCGTAACALGTATLFPPFAALGLTMCYELPHFRNHTGTMAGAKFFGISHAQSRWLFLPTLYNPRFDPAKHNTNWSENDVEIRIKPEMVADRVRQILDGTAPKLKP